MSARQRAGILGSAARLVRGGIAALQLVNGRARGWPGVRLPLRSRVVGSQSMRIAPGFRVTGPVWIEAVAHYEGYDYTPSITLGRNFRSSPGLHISAVNSVVIGDNCLAGSNVFIGDHGHGIYRSDAVEEADTPPYRRQLTRGQRVEIGDNCWLGNNVVVVGDVRIGSNSVIGANSVVTTDVPEDSIAVGAPARPVKTLDRRAGAWVRRL